MEDSLGEKPQVPQQPPPPSNPESPLKQIRTFQGDVAQALSSQNESLYSIQAKERARGSVAPMGASLKPAFFLLGGLLLLAVASGGGWYTYQTFLSKTAPPVVVAPASRFISAESAKEVNLANLGREEIFATIRDASAGAGITELQHLVLREGSAEAGESPLVTAEAFLTKLGASAPGSLVRALEPTFMLGTLGEHRFIIFKLTSFQNAFPGMLTWETTLSFDLADLFVTAEEVKSIGSASVFTDVVYRNKDARALVSGEKPVLLYSFLEREYLIITDEPDALQALIDRLTREKLSR